MTIYGPLNTSEVKPLSNSNRLKFLFILLCVSFPVSIIYVNALQNWSTRVDDKIIQETLEAAATDPNFADRFRYREVVTPELKYILLWTKKDTPPFDYLGTGRKSFIKNKCAFTNCFVTPNRDLLEGDIRKFNAIAFNGRNMRYTRQSELPNQRLPHQKYIFFNLEPSTYQLVCNPWYDGFFNWTSTYKLNSDAVYSYIYIRNKDGEPVGPRIDMEWITDMKEVDEKFKEKLKSKKKTAAWFVSHCITRSKREKYVKLLQKALETYGLTVDVYGRCGPLICYRSQENKCNAMVAKDYYFYLSFENAFAEDYVTEKLLTALNNDAVPIVYGGSDYSRFLPPGSYLNAREHDPVSLAAIMADVLANSTKYHDFFRWRNHYSYSESERVEDVCNLCAALNDDNKVVTESVYEHFRSWWNPDWEERCQDKNWSTRIISSWRHPLLNRSLKTLTNRRTNFAFIEFQRP